MNEVFDKYYYDIYKWSLSKTNNKEDAEDLTNNIFVAIFTYFKKDIDIEKIENLIWKIAYNTWTKQAKYYIKTKNNVDIEDTSISSNDDMLDKIIYKEIVEGINNYNLTNNEKNAFIKYYFEDLSIKEISNIMNTSESNIKYYLYQSRNKIKERFE